MSDLINPETAPYRRRSALFVRISHTPANQGPLLPPIPMGNLRDRGYSQEFVQWCGDMRMALETILLIVLPFGTAIICGAITENAGRVVSGFCSVGGLVLGIYFFSRSMQLFATG
jgi:hypothetical protein